MSTRLQIAEFLDALLLVYILCIIGWIVASLVFSLGVRVPYSRWSNAILDFLRDVTTPFLRLFRWVPRIGPLDLSPMVAIIALQIVGNIVVNAVAG